MSTGAWMMVVVLVLTLGTLGFLIVTMAKSIKNERTKNASLWRQFGLGLSRCCCS